MKFGALLKSAEAEGKEKHVPTLELEGNIVKVVVGKEVPHPNTAEHHIRWIDLYGVKKNGMVIHLGHADFAPGYTKPQVIFHLVSKDFQAFHTLAYCNLHGLWENVLEIE